MMNEAVRVVNALPPVEKIPAVPAFECEAADDGTLMFSRPCPARPTLRIRVFAGAPVIANVPRRLPSLSVIETVTGRLSEAAVEAAWAIISWTSETVRLWENAVPAENRGIMNPARNALIVRRRKSFMMRRNILQTGQIVKCD